MEEVILGPGRNQKFLIILIREYPGATLTKKELATTNFMETMDTPKSMVATLFNSTQEPKSTQTCSPSTLALKTSMKIYK
jgi:hypothetical protein